MHRTKSLILSMALIAVTNASAQTLLWSDEFDGDAVDRSKWTYNVGNSGFGNGELQNYTARTENARLENGNLVITARRENSNDRQFTSARLITHGRFAFRYGDVEARIRVPDLREGLWPAFWCLGNNFGQKGWPECGELDILEMGSADARNDGVTNRRVSAAAHWDFRGSYANYGEATTSPTFLNSDYHLFQMSWTPTQVQVSLDGDPYYTINIANPEENSLEEFHEPHFLLINLAVGGFNYVGLTDPAQITAPFPAEMLIDYVRIYDNGHTEIFPTGNPIETGNFGLLTETTPVNNAVTYGENAELYLWNNLAAGPDDPQEGAAGWNFTANPGNWFGMGVFNLRDRNMANFRDGELRFHMKTTSAHPMRIGVASSSAGEGWVNLSETGFVPNGEWQEVVIPANRFYNVDFYTVLQPFMLAADAPGSAVTFSIDNVYWTPDVQRPAPRGADFGIYTEAPVADTFELGVDGDFYVWENTLNAIASNPYEGDDSLALTSAPGLNWFGAAFTTAVKHDLTAFDNPNGKLRFALKTTANTTFQIGMKSGLVDGIGQKWIRFEAGNDPYGFVRDGQWHIVEIPTSDFTPEVDFSRVFHLFQILGTDGPITNIEIDDVVLTGADRAPAMHGWTVY